MSRPLLVGLGLMVLVPSALFVGWLMLRTPVGTVSSEPTVRTITTVSSLADAARRLELRNYGYVEQTHVAGQKFVTYERKTGNAEFSVEIVRWSGDQRIKELCFSCRTNEAAFNSKESRRKLWDELDRDVCALVNARVDYLRALADMKEVNDNGLPRHEGRATTSDGWQLHAIEYVGYYKPQVHGKPNDLAMARIMVTHLETEEEMSASAIFELNKLLEGTSKD